MAYFIVRQADIEVTNQYIPDLIDKATSASRLSNQINAFISDSTRKLAGGVYDAFRTNLEVYVEAYNKLSELCVILADHMDAANTEFLQYVSEGVDDDPVDMRHIPKYEEEIKKKNARIAILELVPRTRQEKSGTDEDGNATYSTVPNEPEYSNAQTEIVKLKEEIVELEKKIKYLEKCPSEDSKACEKVEDISIEINKFVADIESLKVSNIA